MASSVEALALLSLIIESVLSQNCYPQGPCNNGYMDKTDGSWNWWGCGSGCAGGTYFTDGVCNCACIPEAPCEPESTGNSSIDCVFVST